MNQDFTDPLAAGDGLKFPIPLAPVHVELIQAELEKILASRAFVQSMRHSRFLRFTVNRGIEGQTDTLKEYVLGVEVFDRGQGFDPRIDSIVRTEASRLRSKLKDYYDTEGQDDPIVVEFAKGSYCPQFRSRDIPATETSHRRRLRPWHLYVALGTVLAFGSGAWFPWNRPLKKSNAQQRLISTLDAGAESASFSPDRSMIAFVSPVNGVPQVWVKNLVEGNPVQRTFGALAAHRPRWSKNGQIVFTFSSGREGPPSAPGIRSDSIWSVLPIGNEPPRKLIDDGRNPSWSWDGNRLVFERRDEIWIANADGTDQRKVDGVPSVNLLLADRAPSFSPDGSLIAFFANEGGSPSGDFWMVPSAGGQVRRLTFDQSEGSSPAWTVDGRFVVFSSARAGSMTLWKLRVAGGTPEPVLVGPGQDMDPDVSRQADQLVYTHTTSTFSLTVLNPHTQSIRVLKENSDQLGAPSYSPDGQKIAFFAHAAGGQKHIFTIHRDGSHLTPITPGLEQNVFPQWSSDGRTLYFYQAYPAVSLRKISLAGGQSDEVVRGWSWEKQNGAQVDETQRKVAYSIRERGASRAAKVRDLISGQETALSSPLMQLRWANDGQAIVGVDLSASAEGTISICPVAASPCQRLTQGHNPVWSNDGSKIYFLRNSKVPGEHALWSIYRNGQDETPVAELGRMYRTMHVFDVSPSGEIVYIRHSQGKRELWLTDFND